VRQLRLAAAIAASAALVAAPHASASGPSVTYSVTSGTSGSNGWYTSDVTATINVSGANDSTCPAVKTFRSSSDSLQCTATDGTSTVSFSLQFKIDKDAPTVSGASADRQPDANGWYNHALSITFSGSDATSGIASCSVVPYSGPDSSSASVTGTCRDNAGNVSAPGSFSLKYDGTAPTVTATPARAPDAGGWYNHPLDVGFSGSDATSGIGSCSGTATYSSPDGAAASVSGSCTDGAGNSASASYSFKYDATPPTVTATPARQPDANGFYNHAISVAFSGTDALSGLAGCDPAVTYAGPDAASAEVAGSCRDNAGNSAKASTTLRYDSTPPRLQDLAVAVGGNGATLTWRQPPDTAAVAIVRTPGVNGRRKTQVYDGGSPRFHDGTVKPGREYRYTLTSRDRAGNTTTAAVKAAVRALYAPGFGSRARAGALLAWAPVGGASYYNVQLFRNGKKVMTAWSSAPQLRLPAHWTFGGKQMRLEPGRYRWYVWPGIGRTAARRYGKLLGASAFVVGSATGVVRG
jgi:hypothetical protein